MKAIDIHAHYLPPLLIEKLRLEPGRFPNISLKDVPGGTVKFKLGEEEWTRPVAPGLMNLQGRIEEMDREHVDIQMNAGWMDIFGYSLPAEEAAEWSRFLNETMLEALGAHSGGKRFLSLATVPLQDGELAAAELRAAKKEGHVGVMIGSWIQRGSGGTGFDLDDPSLDPFWKEAVQSHMPIFLHPVFAGTDSRTKHWGMVNAVARPNETAVSLSRLLYAGVPQRFPGLKLIVSHGGGSLPIILGRIERNYEILKEHGEDVYSPREGFRQLYFDSVVFEPEALRLLLNLTDFSKVMLGSDAPFPIRDPHPLSIINSEQLDLSEEVKRAILVENAQRMFKLSNISVLG